MKNRREMRIAGIFYVVFLACSLAADNLASFALTDADKVISRILSNDVLFRIGIGFNILSALFFLLSAWALHELLREYGRGLALLFLILNAVGASIQAFSSLLLLSASALMNNAEFAVLPAGVDPTSILRFFVSMYDNSFMGSQLFFSTWLLPLGILIHRSRILPRILGILLIADFAGILMWFFQHLLAPNARALSYPALMISIAAEFGLALMLLLYRPRTLSGENL